MKHVFFTILFVLFAGLASEKSFAETSVNIENNGEGASSEVRVESSTGESTVCVNGNCTTTQNGGSSATVCINGKCETSQDGNIQRKEGGADVSVQQNSQGATQTVTLTPTLTPTPEQEASKSAEASDSANKSEIKDPSASSGQEKRSAFEEWMNNIRNFFNDLFSQNK